MTDLITAIVTILPVVLAGLSFIFILHLRWLKFLRLPIDFGVTIYGHRLFGQNKTFLGIFVMTIGSIIWFTVLYCLLQVFGWSDYIARLNITGLVSFALIGLSYSLGELPNSFIKRQRGVKPGLKSPKPLERFIFGWLDIADSVLFVSITATLIWNYNYRVFLWMFVLGILIHVCTDRFMRYLGLKQKYPEHSGSHRDS